MMKEPISARAIKAAAAACAGLDLAFLLWALTARPAWNTDFRGLWSFALFARRHAAALYRTAPLQAFQHRLYPGFQSFFPFQYPPSFLLPAWWLGGLGFCAAETAWTLGGIAALAAAAALLFPGRRRFAVLTLLASPAALLNGAQGETGFFTAALLLGGFALLPARPWLAGIAFGLLTVKPQLGVLVPFALLARRDYAAIAGAGLTALALVLLSLPLFPAGLWAAWLRSLAQYQAQYLAAGAALNLHGLVTVNGNLIALGLAPGPAWMLQAAASAAAGAGTFLLFRHAPCRLAMAGLFAAAGLAAPHAYIYDAIPLAAAMLLLEPGPALAAICLLGYLSPLLLLTGAKSWFLYTIPETLLFLAAGYLANTRDRRPNTGHEPIPSGESHPGTG